MDGRSDSGGVIRVRPEELHHSAAMLHEIAQDLKTAHGQAHGQLTDLLSEFGEGHARSMLAEHLSTWEEETRSHHEHLTGQAEFHTTMAHKFVEIDKL